MRKNGKIFLSMLIVLCMICALFPFAALAESDPVEAINIVIVETLNDNVAVTVSGEDAVGVNVSASSADAGVTVEGTVSATQTDTDSPKGYDAYGVNVYASGYTATVETGDVNATGKRDDAAGVNAMTVAGGTADVTVGEIEVSSKDDGFGVNNFTSGASSTTIETGDITVDADYWGKGIDSDAKNEGAGETIVDIKTGDIEVNGSHDSYGVSVQAEVTGSGKATTTVDVGDIVVSTDSDHTAFGVYAKSNGDGATLEISTENICNIVELHAENGGVTTLNVDGDVAAGEDEAIDGTAIALVPVGGSSEINVDVDGTINGSTLGVSVQANQAEQADGSVSITAWKIEVNSDEHVLGFVKENGDIVYNDASEAMEKNIFYYIKTDDSVSGATLKAVDSQGTEVDKATEGTKVFLKVDLKPGYKVKGVYNGKGDLVPMQKDEQTGDYYVEVERGGGVFLSVSLAKLSSGKPKVINIYREDGSIEVTFIVQKDGIKIVKTGEPDAAAMAILSEGIDGECIYKANYEFNDNLKNHGKFQIIFRLPGYEGQKVTIATIVDGSQVLYKDLAVGNDGAVSINADHLGDYAIFLE